MKILVHDREGLDCFSEYFHFNDIDHQRLDFWTIVDEKNNIGEYIIPGDLSNTLIIIDTASIIDILGCDFSTTCLTKFIEAGNILWVADRSDTTKRVFKEHDKFKKLDNLALPNSVVLWLDAECAEDYDFGFKNLLHNLRWYQFIVLGRVKGTTVEKKSTSKDFFITTVAKNHARQLLIEKIHKKPILLENSLIHAPLRLDYNNWLGEKTNLHCYVEAFPSMDLYNNSWFEVVPETLFENHYYTTEKTIKPMVTKTPFLILSTPGYLQYLQSIGFKTFNNIIDESYDREKCLQTRVKKIVSVMEDIVINGSRDFYNQSQNILEHNLNKLCEIHSKKKILQDNLILEWIQKAQEQIKG